VITDQKKLNLFAGNCVKLPNYLGTVLSVQEQFPVESKDVLQVTVNCKADEKVVGDKSITCYGGTHFIYSKSPGCLPQGLKLNTLNYSMEIIMWNECSSLTI
jgi:hypothetical protein